MGKSTSGTAGRLAKPLLGLVPRDSGRWLGQRRPAAAGWRFASTARPAVRGDQDGFRLLRVAQ